MAGRTRSADGRLGLRAMACTLMFALAAAAQPASAQQAPELKRVGGYDFGPPSGGTVKLAEMRVCVRDEARACTVDENGDIVYEKRDFAFTRGWVSGNEPSDRGNLQVIDVTDPAASTLVASACLGGSLEGPLDIRPDLGLLVAGSKCGSDPAQWSRWITVFDITDPYAPSVIKSVDLGAGDVRRVAFHPTKPFAYVSLSSRGFYVLEADLPGIKVVNLGNLASKTVGHYTVANMYVGHRVNAISFNRSGTRAYVASHVETAIFDTTDPWSPTLIGSIHDPSVKWHSWAKPTPDGKYLAVGDSFNPWPGSGLGNLDACAAVASTGAVHFYDLAVEATPMKVGAFTLLRSWEPPSDNIEVYCANLHFDFDPITGRMAVPWDTQGTFLVDVSDPLGLGAHEVARTDARRDTSERWDPQSSTFFKGRIYNIDAAGGLDIFEVPPGATAAHEESGPSHGR